MARNPTPADPQCPHRPPHPDPALGVHGRGVLALQDIAAGEVLVEYTGEIITWQEAQDRHPHDPSQPNHTFYFHVDEDRVIDANYGGNSARWINHSCDPNCFADEQDGRIFITALRNIAAGEELNYDYGLIIEERYTPKLKAEYPCWCGAATCRGTLLAPKRGWRPPMPDLLRLSPARPNQAPNHPRAAGMTAPIRWPAGGRLGGRGPAAAGLHGGSAAQHRFHQHRADAPRPRRADRAHAAGGRAANRRARPPGPRVAKRRSPKRRKSPHALAGPATGTAGLVGPVAGRGA